MVPGMDPNQASASGPPNTTNSSVTHGPIGLSPLSFSSAPNTGNAGTTLPLQPVVGSQRRLPGLGPVRQAAASPKCLPQQGFAAAARPSILSYVLGTPCCPHKKAECCPPTCCRKAPVHPTDERPTRPDPDVRRHAIPLTATPYYPRRRTCLERLQRSPQVHERNPEVSSPFVQGRSQLIFPIQQPPLSAAMNQFSPPKGTGSRQRVGCGSICDVRRIRSCPARP